MRCVSGRTGIVWSAPKTSSSTTSGACHWAACWHRASIQELLKANRERFERKWGIEWQPHRHRPGPAYRRLIAADQGGRPGGHPRRCEGARHQQGRSRLARSRGEGRPALPARRGWLLCRLPSGRERRRDRPPGVHATSRGRISPHPRARRSGGSTITPVSGSTSPTPARRCSATPICA